LPLSALLSRRRGAPFLWQQGHRSVEEPHGQSARRGVVRRQVKSQERLGDSGRRASVEAQREVFQPPAVVVEIPPARFFECIDCVAPDWAVLRRQRFGLRFLLRGRHPVFSPENNSVFAARAGAERAPPNSTRPAAQN
jgi:hypothetical protein